MRRGNFTGKPCGNFKSFLDDRKKDQPFAYWFGPTNVHRKWTKGSGKKLWDIDPDKLKGQDALHFCRMFMQLERILPITSVKLPLLMLVWGF
jgi:hypothetical protein